MKASFKCAKNVSFSDSQDDSIEFPTQYPSGCLLGCVSVQVNILRNSEFSLLKRKLTIKTRFSIFRIVYHKKSTVQCIQMVNRRVHLFSFARIHKSYPSNSPSRALIKFVRGKYLFVYEYLDFSLVFLNHKDFANSACLFAIS